MQLLIVTYTQSPEVAALHTETHGVWVKKYFANGTFVAAGPKKDKNGGVILSRSLAPQDLEKILAEDSFVQHKVARYDVIDMDCKLASPGFEVLQSL